METYRCFLIEWLPSIIVMFKVQLRLNALFTLLADDVK